jgi:hypothetical protein
MRKRSPGRQLEPVLGEAGAAAEEAVARPPPRGNGGGRLEMNAREGFMFKISRALFVAAAVAILSTGTSLAQQPPQAPPPGAQQMQGGAPQHQQKPKHKCGQTPQGCHKQQKKQQKQAQKAAAQQQSGAPPQGHPPTR